MSKRVDEQLAALNDPVLAEFFRCSEDESEAVVERLIVERALPVVNAILSRHSSGRGRLNAHDMDDISSTTQLRLVRKLRAVALSAEDAVRDFEQYVARLTYNAINDHLRSVYPERARLKNRVRYLLTHDKRLALWNTGERVVCGLEGWRGRAPGAGQIRDIAQWDGGGTSQPDHADAVAAFFAFVGQPIPLNDAVSLLAVAWGVTDTVPVNSIDVRSLVQPVRDFEMREHLTALWREINLLRPTQRIALLMNLRTADVVNPISLFVLTGTAPFDDLAAALQMSPAALAALWNDLPLTDLQIGAILGVTRQQVINLRKSARERLARRMRRDGAGS